MYLGNHLTNTWLPREISRICISCVYLLPCQNDVEGFYKYFYNCYDKLCMGSPNLAFIVTGDLNPTSNGFRIDISTLIVILNKLSRKPQEAIISLT